MSKWVRDNRAFLGFLLLFGLFRTAVADWNPIPSGSMRPTIQEGDVVLVNRLAYNLKLPLTNVVLARLGEPRRGDIVTFYSPKNGMRLIKRVIGLPGDTVEMRDKVLIINGLPLAYTPLGQVVEPRGDDAGIDALRLGEGGGQGRHVVQWLPAVRNAANDNFGPLTVPADHFLMLGDNRDNSADSRYFGLVPRELLIGRAVTILVAADIKGDWMPRFERFGERLN
ncbi:MAG: signal peptidase I [Nevskia sp.]|nr:signal peptidase I [Nevskia sp.]